MTRTLALTALLTSAALPALSDAHAGTRGFALAEDGATLVTMADISMPEMVETVALSTPVAGLAYRPVTGELLGISNGSVVSIDPMTGETTDLGATFTEDATLAEGAPVAFDFNNAIDAVRAVSGAGDNLVYFPEGFGDGDDRANSVRRFTDAFYLEGDDNAGAEPMIFANAYTNAISGMTAESTFQYALDASTDALVSLANNAGELTTVGPVTVDGAAVDLSPMGGFDIVSPEEGTDMAFAILQIEGEETAGLYSMDLTSGAATLLADLGMGGITGFAVAPAAM
ncbi:MAG: DUF4394 domain-containing protein [Paracoccaceae bacterium]